MRLSDEEKIEVLTNRINNFKKALLDPNSFDSVLYQSSSPKKDKIRSWAEALEELHSLGQYPEEISTISTHIRRELKSMGLEKAMSWAKQALPFKYKDSSKIHAEKLLDYELQDSRDFERHKKSKEQITRENQPYIDKLLHYSRFYLDIAKKLETMEFLCFIPPNEIDELFTRGNSLESIIRDAVDGRDKVMVSKLHLLIHAFNETTKSDAFAKYMKYVKRIVDITPKQAVRLATGRVTKVEMLYEPTNRMEARHAGFYGVECEECGSWRVDKKYNTDENKDKLFCFACKEWSKLKTLPLLPKSV